MSNQPIVKHELRIFSLDLVYYCFYMFAMFMDIPPVRNKASRINLVLICQIKQV